jgi:hypothetical protein
MLYRNYRITFADLNYDNPVFLITRRHDTTILGKTTSVSSALDLIRLIDTQGEFVLDPRPPRDPLAVPPTVRGETQ